MKSNKISISADEKKWRAESDLDALKRAMEIKNDKARFAAAQGVAKQQIAALGGLVKSKPSSLPVSRKRK